MDTPIKDFVNNYAKKNKLRLHVPGHKGKDYIGVEKFDLTEIDGADCLYNASGIIKTSQLNASNIFNANTFYSTEGSSLSIRAMVYLALKNSKSSSPYILAGRNAHKSFISAVGLLGLDVDWIYPKGNSYLACDITPSLLDNTLKNLKTLPIAVYITTPDYLGNMLDVYALSKVCKKFGVLLLVDNAHGSYLKFLEDSLHPIDLGADMCCDSAHKTLPALTGASYLHLSKDLPSNFVEQAQDALSLFASTSPSYLILQSLDNLNAYLFKGYKEKLGGFIAEVNSLKEKLILGGYKLIGNEPLKITLDAKAYGYLGEQLSKLLSENDIVVEFYDTDYVVLMLTPELSKDDLSQLLIILLSIKRKKKIISSPPSIIRSEKVCSIRNALLSPTKKLDTRLCEGKILGTLSVNCPPAVPILVCGEKIDKKAIERLLYYNIDYCDVLCD